MRIFFKKKFIICILVIAMTLSAPMSAYAYCWGGGSPVGALGDIISNIPIIGNIADALDKFTYQTFSAVGLSFGLSQDAFVYYLHVAGIVAATYGIASWATPLSTTTTTSGAVMVTYGTAGNGVTGYTLINGVYGLAGSSITYGAGGLIIQLPTVVAGVAATATAGSTVVVTGIASAAVTGVGMAGLGIACATSLACSSGTIGGTPMTVVVPQGAANACRFSLPVKFYIPQMGENTACTVVPITYTPTATFILSGPDGPMPERTENVSRDHIYRDASCSIKDPKGGFGEPIDEFGYSIGCFPLPEIHCTPTSNFSEANSEIAIYRFDKSNTISDDEYAKWLFETVAGQSGSGYADVEYSNYYNRYLNPIPFGYDSECGEPQFTAGPTVESAPYFIGPASSVVCSGGQCAKLCDGNVCTFNDPDVPDDSYVVYVAKVVGVDYVGAGNTKTGGSDLDGNTYPYCSNDSNGPDRYVWGASCTARALNKFLNNDGADTTTFSSVPSQTIAIGNAIVGPYQTPSETADCLVNCGSANGTSVSSTPTTETLCSGTDTASAVSLSGGMYTWTCTRSSGATATCSATRSIDGVCANGASDYPTCVCGTASGKTYPVGSSSYGSDTQCLTGVSSNTAFPPAGGSSAWLCLDANGQPLSGRCLASVALQDISCTATAECFTVENACSKSCGGGTKVVEVCTRADCTIFNRKTETCNSQPCPPGYREVAPW